jgi:hypothetical protein
MRSGYQEVGVKPFAARIGVIVPLGVAAFLVVLGGSPSQAECSDGESTAAGQRDVAPEPLIVRDARPDTEMDERFEGKDGWIGGDGANSVALPGERILWLFSDTWVGKVRGGKRVEAALVNNSAALQEGRGANAKMRFVVRQGDDGKPRALITPEEGRGWFWLQAAATVDERLILFLNLVEKTGDPGVFGFRQTGERLGIVGNPRDDPTAWRIKQRKVPFTFLTAERAIAYGAAVLRDGAYLYVYGWDEDIKPKIKDRYLTLARVPAGEVEDFAAWRFYHGGRWEADFRTADRLVPGMAPEYSVTFHAGLKRYVLVYTELGLSDKILGRTARTPWGPWSAPTTLYQCPEMGRDKKVFCYGGKAPVCQAAEDELVVCYFVNSTDFWQVAADARLYWPRFVRVRLRLND